jgi:hypothetical protein
MMGLDLYGLSLFGFFFHLFLVCLAAYILGRRPAVGRTLLLWFACVFLYLQLGPAHLTWGGYVPAHKQLRFLTMAAMPAALFSAIYLAEMKRAAAVSAVLFMVLTSAYGTAKMAEYHAFHAEPYERAFAYVKSAPPGSVSVPDADWRARLNFYYRSPLSLPYYPSGGAGGVRLAGEPRSADAMPPSWRVAAGEAVAPEPTGLGPVKTIALGGGVFLKRYSASPPPRF